ncbi:hypothetical protein COCMIDRAFT_27591 [Bipolaris oryzae ATCC 44560]|uniref:Uncharacterized protein n=1 Tax=Bipolaris oryzae ATCC 44560 TaxID=930090 RepID=W6ZKF0_COCMI|nr:uncharacterized protein COCMIDRAFT_27591 [Bipolaris oryzae ATCC 44560]EUC44056.1 hypothetical protein COCMIDRAFT_27591 [Bipolaris oryzae ATCC 44560]
MTPRANTTKKPHSPTPIPSPPPSTSTYSTCSKKCCTNPCIAGPSSSTPNKRPTSPTPPFTYYSSISNPYLGPKRLRCAPQNLKVHAPLEYPRQERNGRVDKGKARAKIEMVGGGRGGGAHMMNYTRSRKKWSHDTVARMRQEDNSSSIRNTAAAPVISPPAPAQPHVAVAVASPASRRDSMEPEAQRMNITPLATVLSPQPQPQSPSAQRQMQHSANESGEEVVEREKGKSKLHLMKRIWSSLTRK